MTTQEKQYKIKREQYRKQNKKIRRLIEKTEREMSRSEDNAENVQKLCALKNGDLVTWEMLDELNVPEFPVERNSMKENEIIKNTIDVLEHGDYEGRKQLIKQLHDNGYVVVDGLIFRDEGICWSVWKPTNEYVNPEYKGQSLSKIVPAYMEIDRIPQVLDAQQWVYW